MNCPACKIPLTLSERQGIEIDYCPQCRGVWLDRGELDKIIEKSSISEVQRGKAEQPYPRQTQETSQFGRHGDDHDSDHHGKRKRKSFLSDLFD
jgi:Zn-finger nucleic acid-binding protein